MCVWHCCPSVLPHHSSWTASSKLDREGSSLQGLMFPQVLVTHNKVYWGKTEAKAQTFQESSNCLEGRDERKGWKTQLTKTSGFFTLIAGCNYQGKVLQPPLKEISLWIRQFSACFSAAKSRGGTAILQWQQGRGQNHGKERQISWWNTSAHFSKEWHLKFRARCLVLW